MVTWPKFGNSSIPLREVIITSVLLGFEVKNWFFEGLSKFKLNNLKLAQGMTLKFWKRIKTKIQNVLWAIFFICRSYSEKNWKVRGTLFATHILNKIKIVIELKLILKLIFITFIIYFILILYSSINVFMQNLATFFRNALYMLFRILSIFIFYCFVFFVITSLICIFDNIVNLFYI